MKVVYSVWGVLDAGLCVVSAVRVCLECVVCVGVYVHVRVRFCVRVSA